MAQRPNATIYYVPSGYSTTGPQIMGIQAASEGFLRAMACDAGLERLFAFVEYEQNGAAFADAVQAFNPRMPTSVIPTNEVERIGSVGTLQLPGPGLSAYGWMRRRIGATAFSLCGVTHTTATPLVLDALADLWTAPIEPWDALICTSQAVRSMVTTVLEDQRQYLEQRFGRFSRVRPQLPVIPLGVNAAAFARDANSRPARRAELGISSAETVLLFVGRLNPVEKAHPVPLFLAAAAASRKFQGPLHLLLAGWFQQPGLEAAYREAAAMICPDVRLTILDGRLPDVRAGVWQAADIFISPVDNVQETFGLSPLEAMAAGLPVIASDWDGYRETVRHGLDGLLVRTITPPAGSSSDIERDYGSHFIGYDAYVGVSSQAVAVDVAGLTDAIVSLAENPDLRHTMGAAGAVRAKSEFDWSRIIGRYQELWSELAERRKSGETTTPASPHHPARPEPFRAFARYPSHMLSDTTSLVIGMTAPAMIEILLGSALISFAQKHLPAARALEDIIARVETGSVSALELVNLAPDEPTEPRWRGIAWLLKYGFLQIA